MAATPQENVLEGSLLSEQFDLMASLQREQPTTKRVINVCFLGTGSSIDDSDLDRKETLERYPNGEVISAIAQDLQQIGAEVMVFNGAGYEDRNASQAYNERKPWSFAADAVTGFSMYHNVDDAVLRISNMLTRRSTSPELTETYTQALQLAAIDESTIINIFGWSRGAITALMCASTLYDCSTVPGLELFPELLRKAQVNLFLIDPVPGPGNSCVANSYLQPNVRECKVYLAQHERSEFFACIVPTPAPGNSTTVCDIQFMPGGHATLSGSVTNHAGTEILKDMAVAEIGMLVKNSARAFAARHGVQWQDDVDFSDEALLALYNKIARHRDTLAAFMLNDVYTFDQAWLGDWRLKRHDIEARLAFKAMQTIELSRLPELDNVQGVNREHDILLLRKHLQSWRETFREFLDELNPNIPDLLTLVPMFSDKYLKALPEEALKLIHRPHTQAVIWEECIDFYAQYLREHHTLLSQNLLEVQEQFAATKLAIEQGSQQCTDLRWRCCDDSVDYAAEISALHEQISQAYRSIEDVRLSVSQAKLPQLTLGEQQFRSSGDELVNLTESIKQFQTEHLQLQAKHKALLEAKARIMQARHDFNERARSLKQQLELARTDTINDAQGERESLQQQSQHYAEQKQLVITIILQIQSLELGTELSERFTQLLERVQANNAEMVRQETTTIKRITQLVELLSGQELQVPACFHQYMSMQQTLEEWKKQAEQCYVAVHDCKENFKEKSTELTAWYGELAKFYKANINIAKKLRTEIGRLLNTELSRIKEKSPTEKTRLLFSPSTRHLKMERLEKLIAELDNWRGEITVKNFLALIENILTADENKVLREPTLYMSFLQKSKPSTVRNLEAGFLFLRITVGTELSEAKAELFKPVDEAPADSPAP